MTSRDRGGVPFRIQCAHKRLPLDIAPSCGVPGTPSLGIDAYWLDGGDAKIMAMLQKGVITRWVWIEG